MPDGIFNNWPEINNSDDGVRKYISELLRAINHLLDQSLLLTCCRDECLNLHRENISGMDIARSVTSSQSWNLLWKFIHLVIDPVPRQVTNTNVENIYGDPGLDLRYLHSEADGHCRLSTLWNILMELPSSIKRGKSF